MDIFERFELFYDLCFGVEYAVGLHTLCVFSYIEV